MYNNQTQLDEKLTEDVTISGLQAEDSIKEQQTSAIVLYNPQSTHTKTITELACEYLDAGLSVIPINSAKEAIASWKQFQTRLATKEELAKWKLEDGKSIAFACGKASGNLEVIDIDEIHNLTQVSLFDRWKAIVGDQRPQLTSALVIAKSKNNGRHIFYKCPTVEGNQKLAMREASVDEKKTDPKCKRTTLIETRGEGGYIAVYPSVGYQILQGSFTAIPEITVEEREILLNAARSLNEYVPETSIVRGNQRGVANLPGDEFNNRGDVRPILEKNGWKHVSTRSENELWRRPGKTEGTSATYSTLHNLFYVFSSNASPFEPDKAYNKFSVYALLEHDGDFKRAARALAEQGYGTLSTSGPQTKIELVEDYINSRYEFRKNLVKQRIEFRVKGENVVKTLDDVELNSLYRELQHNSIPVNIDALSRILNSDFSESYDPFKQYFETLDEWDGKTDYIAQLAETVVLENASHKDAFRDCLKRWLVGSVASVVNDEAVNQTAIILVGEQGIGKSRWLNRLLPPVLSSYKFVGTINPENKDTLIYLSECYLINLDELETLRKAEIGALKTVMTMASIKIRYPYDKFPIDVIRRASFVGSINNREFLNDPSGSRRFLVFEVKSIDMNKQIDFDAVFAQAYSLYKAGEQWWFTEEETAEINKRNIQYSVSTYEEEMVTRYCSVGDVAKNDGIWMSSTDIASKIKERDEDFKVDNGSVRNIGVALKKNKYPLKKPHNVSEYYVRLG
jgi:hypothetical protein